MSAEPLKGKWRYDNQTDKIWLKHGSVYQYELECSNETKEFFEDVRSAVEWLRDKVLTSSNEYGFNTINKETVDQLIRKAFEDVI